MTGLPLIAQARADLELVGWRLNVLLTLAHELLDVHEYRRVKTVSPVLDPGRSVG